MTPRNAILVSILVLIVCLAGAPRLSINADTRVFFSEENENRQALNLFEARYASSVNLLIAVHARQGDVFTQDRLSALEALTEAAWRLPYATRVESIVNASHVSSDEEGVVIAETAALDAAGSVAAARARVMADGMLVGRLIAEDGRTTAVNVMVDYPMSSSAATGEILDAAKAMVADAGLEAAGLEAWYGGRVASSYAFSTASKKDLTTLIPLTFLVFLVLLIFLLRSVVIAGALFATALCAAASAMGLAGWAGLQINAATAHVPTMIIALGVASLAHLAVSTRRHIRDGDHQDDAVAKALKTDARPIALTLSTTSLGFLTLLAADAPPFQQLGGLVAVGAGLCLFYGLVLLPALLRSINIRLQAPRSLIMQTVTAATDLAVGRRRLLLAIVPLGGALAIAGLSRIVIDDTFPDYFDERFEFRRHADLIEEHLTGLEVVEFDIGGAAENAIYDAAYIDKLDQFETWLSGQPKVAHVSSILEIYRRLNRHLTDGRIESAVVPDDREALAQYILLYEMSLPLGQDMTNAITIDKARSRVTAIMRGASTSEVRALRERAEGWLASTPSTAIDGDGTGLAVMFAYLSSLNVKSMIGGTALALVMISAMLVLAFRSLRYGAMSLVPNLLPGAAAFGLWGYFVGEVGVAVSVVGAMTLGIIVDDTIHLIWRYREARADGADPDVAARAMFAKVGEPMLISSIVLIAGFLLLSVSGFHITSSTGVLVAGTIAFALVMDWFLLTPLLVVADQVSESRKASPPQPALALAVDNPRGEAPASGERAVNE
ncbi:MAG: efflux RND transporter permease subunit [Hyphococcus sp.]